MKGISIPDHRIHHAYLVIGQEEDLLRQMAKDFVVRLFHKSKKEEPEKQFSLPLEESTENRPDFYSEKEEPEDSLSLRIEKEEHPDLIFVDYQEKENGEKKSSISIDQIRQEVKGPVDISPKVLSRVVRVYVGDMPIDKQWKLLQEIPALRALPAFLKEIAHKKQEEMQKYAEELGQLDGQELYCFLDIILRDVLCYKSTKDHHLLYGQSARESITAMAEKYSYWTLGQWGEYIERYKEGRAVNVAQNYQILDFFLFLSNT